MKKISLFLIIVLSQGSVSAQFNPIPIVQNHLIKEHNIFSDIQNFKPKERSISIGRAAPRWYSIVDAVDKSNGGQDLIYANGNIGTLWEDSSINIPYDNGGGVFYDNSWITSIAQVLDPTEPRFNDIFWYAGQAHVNKNMPYTLDSVGIYGLYRRNPNKLNIVDTLIVSIIHGDSSGTIFDINKLNTGPSTSYSTTDLRFAYSFIELNPYSLEQFEWLSSNNTNNYSIRLPLTAAIANDTLSSGINYIELPVNLSVPAGNLLNMSVSFKSGDTWPVGDSLMVIGAGADPKYNNFRFLSFEENAGGFGSYEENHFNASSLLTIDTSGWGNIHVPSYFFTSAVFPYELHYFEWKLNCPACWPILVEDFEEQIGFSLSPNPVTDRINIRMSLGQRAEKVQSSIFSMTGKLVQKHDLGTLEIGQQDVQIALVDLAAGLYLFKLDVDGQRLEKKLLVRE